MYCVNCGVKLADTEKNCPLCGVTAFHPDIVRAEAEHFYPTNPVQAYRINRIPVMVVITAIFLLSFMTTLLCDYQLNRTISWSGYVMGGLLVAYVSIVLPCWFRSPNPAIFVPCSFATVGLYVYYINAVTGGNWFLSFALPIVVTMGAIIAAVATLMRYVPKGGLYIFGGAFTAIGVFLPIMELLLNLTFELKKFIGWSLYPLVALVLLGGILIYLAISRNAREKMERKFFI